MLTPRENFLRYLKWQEYEWIPTSEDQRMFQPAMLPDNVCRKMVMEQEPFAGEPGGVDLFGCHWEFIPAANGSIEIGNLMEDLSQWREKVTIPDLDKMDWEGCAKANAEYLKTDKLLRSTIYTGYFERLIGFIGFENAAMALIDEDQEEVVHEVFNFLTEVYMDVITRMNKYFGIELMELHDDWGTQRSPIFSKDALEEMLLPYITRLVNHCHQLGMVMEMHSCGRIEPLIPSLIETGIDTWRGQLICDKEMLVSAYGDKFHFGVEIREEADATDEDAKATAERMVQQWKGRNIWFAIGRNYTPSQRNAIVSVIKNAK